MYAIKEGLAKINGEQVRTYKREIREANTALSVEAGTTGYKGGCFRDAGGRTYVSVRCLCGDFHFSLIKDADGNAVGADIAMCGDDALNAIVKALDFAREALDDQRRDVDD